MIVIVGSLMAIGDQLVAWADAVLAGFEGAGGGEGGDGG
jgi:hypothetical protein